jgi:SAM-dependent methyltransferase
MSNACRPHLGASSLELLSKTPTAEFIDPTWLHFGDEPNYSARSEAGIVKLKSRNLAKSFLRTLRLGSREGDPSHYQQSDFRPWMFNKGDRLPLDDGKVSFIYSDHVLEHFRYDIATQLLSEAFRVLKPRDLEEDDRII